MESGNVIIRIIIFTISFGTIVDQLTCFFPKLILCKYEQCIKRIYILVI
jgi:hypothetical protein